MNTHGVDVLVNMATLKKRLKWDNALMFSYTNDKVTSYVLKPNLSAYLTDASFNGNSVSLFAPTVGKPLFGVYSRKWAGLNPANGNPMGYVNGKPSENYSALLSSIGKTVDSLVYHGRVLPSVFGSWRSTLSYKRLTFAFNFSYQLGFYFRNSSINYSSLFSKGSGHSDFAIRWQQPGDELKTHVPSFTNQINTNRESFYSTSSILVEKGDHIRLQDLSLDYEFNIPVKLQQHIKRINIFAYANNLGIVWSANKNGIDPQYPNQLLPRSYALGLKFTL
jgi:hypothetical protein